MSPTMKHALSLAVLAVLGITQVGLALLHPPSTRVQDAPEDVDLSSGLPEGVSLTELAVGIDRELDRDMSPMEALFIELQRVPIAPDLSLTGREVFEASSYSPYSDLGSHLIYVESGEIAVSVDGRARTYRKGEHAVIPESADYELRNESGACALLLRLAAGRHPGMAGGEASESVPNLPTSCGEPQVLLASGPSAQPLGTMLLFIAETTWEPNTTVTHKGHTGPVSLLLDSGQLQVTDRGIVGIAPKSDEGDFRTTLHEGSAVTIPLGHGYWIRNPLSEPATALMVGAVAADQGLQARRHYMSANNTFRLTYDDTWRVTGEEAYGTYQQEGWNTVEWLRLENGLTVVAFEVFTYQQSARDCIDEEAASYRNAPNVRNLTPMEDANGEPMEGGDAKSAFARYSYTYALADGKTKDLVVHFECHAFIMYGVERVVQATGIIPRGEFDTQIRAVEQLLDGLVVAG